MPQIINTNIASLSAQRNLNKSQSLNQQALERLSSGLRVNSAKDDAAGLAISTRFNSQISGLNVAVRNAGDGIALAQTAEGALGTINDNLQRIRELAVQSANATNSDDDRAALQSEAEQLIAEVSRIADETDFNGRKLLNGEFSANFQIGANAGQTVNVSIEELTAEKLGASSQSGVSAIGNGTALSNGDLTINGVDVLASKAESDTSSDTNNAASAISKAAAINAVYDETGVRAYVNENEVAGTEMTASADSGILYLNGEEITVQTTSSAATSRAAVVEAINAFQDKTGVRAEDSGTDAGGVSLVAEDGRNITIGVDVSTWTAASTSAIAAATGLAEGATYNSTTNAITGTVAQATYEGGYTLVADGDVSEIVVEGGNGTGNGDLTNSGLVAGTYTRGEASLVSEKQTASTAVTLLGDGTFTNTVSSTGTYLTTTELAYQVTVGDTTANGVLSTNGTVAWLADTINTDSNISGVTAYEQISLNITDIRLMTTGNVISFGGVNVTFSDASGTTTQDFAQLVDDINDTDFSGANIDVEAQFDGTDIALTIRNYSSTSVAITNGTHSTANIVFATDTVTSVGFEAQGQLAFFSDTGEDVTISLSDPDADNLNQIIDATGANVTISGSYTGVNGLQDGDLIVNGVAISAALDTDDTASATFASDGSKILSSEKGLSAIAVAAAINKVTEETGVTAEVNATEVVGGDGSNVPTSNYEVGDVGEIYINGFSLGSVTLQDDGTGSIDADKAKSDALTVINESTGKTGVRAEDNGVSLTLIADDGRNISVAINNQAGVVDALTTQNIGAYFGLDSQVAGIGEQVFSNSLGGATFTSSEALAYETTYGTVQLSSASEITVDLGTNGNTQLEALGFKSGTYGGGEDGQFLKDLDISTVEGAQAAITAIDNAIGAVASQRANLGAIQNRLESTISNLAVTSENLSAANSRIQDADFAAETAKLSKSQVLQQAGISVLAQANAGPQQVLSLLQ